MLCCRGQTMKPSRGHVGAAIGGKCEWSLIARSRGVGSKNLPRACLRRPLRNLRDAPPGVLVNQIHVKSKANETLEKKWDQLPFELAGQEFKHESVSHNA